MGGWWSRGRRTDETFGSDGRPSGLDGVAGEVGGGSGGGGRFPRKGGRRDRPESVEVSVGRAPRTISNLQTGGCLEHDFTLGITTSTTDNPIHRI